MHRDIPIPRPVGSKAAVVAALQAAIAAMGAGNLDEAERWLKGDAAALRTPIGQNILGDIHLKRGSPKEALKAFDAALKLAPKMPEAHCNRAAALQEIGRLEDAVAAADKAIRLRPQYATAFFNRGNALKALARHEEAIAAYSKALALKPAFEDALLNRGHVHVTVGGWLEALRDFNKVLTLNSANVGAHVGRASAYRGLYDMPAAFAAIDAAAALEPDSLDVALMRANVLISADRHEDALAAADAAIVLRPESSRAHAVRAQALTELKRHDEALAEAEEAIRLGPRTSSAHLAYAVALHAVGRPEDSLAALERAADLGATGPAYFNARAVATVAIGDAVEALRWFDRGVALEPKSPVMHYNRAFAYLTLGQFEKGWPEYEWRLKHRDSARPDMQGLAPQWRGEDLTGKKLLIYAEQGHGDSIQFTRYLPLVAARGGKITLSVQEALSRLYEFNFPELDVTAKLGMRSGYDYQISLMSLPFVFETTLDTIPQNVPYLRADPVRAEKWRERLGPNGFKVGIAWQGNPKYGADRDRSISMTEFAPVAAMPGVRVISLQWTGGKARLAEVGDGPKVESLGEEIENNPDGFREVAAVMANLDLLLSSDTGPAHLAGALGRPAWVALTKRPDWRWMLEGTTTPWYPTMRLFRQKTRGDWPAVFGEIVGELKTLVDARG